MYINIYIYTSVFHSFFFSNRSCFGAKIDTQYEACATKMCGNQIISFPFFINGQQKPYCGSPGYNLTCQNNSTLLQITEDDDQYLFVNQIFYQNHTLRVSNAALRSGDGGGSCNTIKKTQSLTISGDKFVRVNNANLVLLRNCSGLDERLKRYRVGCDNNINMLAMTGNNEELLRSGMDSCRIKVVVPTVDDRISNNGSSEYYLEVMRKGFVLKWIATNCTECQSSGGRCGFNYQNYQFICFCKDRPRYRTCTSTSRNSKHLVLGTVSGAAGACALILLLIFYISCRHRNTQQDSSLFPRNASSYPKDVVAFLRQYGTSTPKRFRYSTIKKMTTSFKDELGKGGYGTVYKGYLSDGHVVAVKVLNAAKGNGEEFLNEVASIGRTSHVNVVKLVGFCYEGKKRALIYDYMPNGSLEKVIYGKVPSMEGQHLGWEKLFNIALGIARGLDYLHCGCNTRILHFDIKPHNILLDKDFRPKISDFGLAKLYNENESNVSSIIQARGTIGYIAPEVFSRNIGQVSHKSDVYSYGMMVLEMVGGRKNVHAGADHTSEIYYPRWLYKRIAFNEELYFGSEMSEEETEVARKMVIVGLWCIQMNPVQRPDISKVIEMLEGQIASLEKPPKPYMCSPTDSPSISQSRPHFILSYVTDLDSSRETASGITTA